MDSRIVNRRGLESLIQCGAMDSFGKKRSQLMAVLDQAMSMGALRRKDNESGQMGLFDDVVSDVSTDLVYPDMEEYPLSMRLAMEKEYDGFYFSGHPLDAYTEVMNKLTPLAVLYDEEARGYDGKMITVGGLITAVRRVTTKRNDAMAIITVEDFTHTVTVVVFPKVFEKCRDLIVVDAPVAVKGRADITDDDVQILADTVQPLTEEAAQAVKERHESTQIPEGSQWLEGQGEKLFIKIPARLEQSDLSDKVAEILSRYPGNTKVYFHLAGSRRTILTDKKYWITAGPKLQKELALLLEPGLYILQ